MYKYIFGPVPSRRLQMSLGVDLVPHKVCSLDCVYCECGKTTKLTLERKEYVPKDEVIAELEHFLNNNPAPDYITFSGAGEPTLNSAIGEIIAFVKQHYPTIPVAVLTNGTLLSDKKVRAEIIDADVVLPSFDAASAEAFQKINKPEQSIELSAYLQGLIDFRQEFNGQIWLEVLILPGYNDDEDNLNALKSALTKINPDKIQLNTLDRPGVVGDLKPADGAQLDRILRQWDFTHAEIVASVAQRKTVQSFRQDIESAILETIERRPCTLPDLVKILGLHENEINKYLSTLEHASLIKSIVLERGLFYQLNKSAS